MRAGPGRRPYSPSLSDAPSTTLVGQLLEEYFPFASPVGQLPDPTPAEGPDPYGNPDPQWLEIDWRPHIRQVEVEGARVNYAELGSGPGMPIVFVHGLSGSWQNWLENIPHFAREHRVLALDLPGFGHSPMPEWEISIERYGRLLHDLCGALGVERLRRGRKLDGRLHLGRGRVRPAGPVREAGPGVRRRNLPCADASPARRDGGADGHRRDAPSAPAPGAWHEEAARSLGHLQGPCSSTPNRCAASCCWRPSKTAPAGQASCPPFRGWSATTSSTSSTEVEVPTLIVWGRNDRVVPPQDAVGFAQRLRNSQTVIFETPATCPSSSGRCASTGCWRRSSPVR